MSALLGICWFEIHVFCVAACVQTAILIEELRRRWWRDADTLPRADAQPFDELMKLYGGAGRYYHGIAHLTALFALLDRFVPASIDRVPIHFAVWWHDAIYIPGKSDNEERSAALATLRLEAMGAAATLIDAVHDLILATRSHWDAPPKGDGDYFLDADIAILGAPPDAYLRYAGDVRREYAYLDETAFRGGRSAFLRSALERPMLFRTQAFGDAFTAQARTNMRAELDRLCADS